MIANNSMLGFPSVKRSCPLKMLFCFKKSLIVYISISRLPLELCDIHTACKASGSGSLTYIKMADESSFVLVARKCKISFIQ